MRSLLLGAVFAVDCGLPASIDPDHACTLTEYEGQEYGSLDADSLPGNSSAVALQLEATVSYMDQYGKFHAATYGEIEADAANARYVLGCPQPLGNKTIKVSVTRPTDLGDASYFGAEWIAMFPKDSWTSVYVEHEAFAHDEYGTKVPLPELTSPTRTTLAQNFGSLTAHFEAPLRGDFEFKFGNPNLVYGPNATWTTVEFSQTILRVGSPWATCDYEPAPAPQAGAIVPLLLGNPNSFEAEYLAAAAALEGVSVPTYVVLDVFAPGIAEDGTAVASTDRYSYPGHADYDMCYRLGAPCPLGHAVCDAAYCSVARFAAIADALRAASPYVQVLGFLDASHGVDAVRGDVALYAEHFPALDGYFFGNLDGDDAATLRAFADFVGPKGARPAGPGAVQGLVVFSTGQWLTVPEVLDSADVVVTLNTDAAAIQEWSPFAWYPAEPPTRWAAIATGVNASDLATVAAELQDRGYGYVYMHSAAGEGALASVSEHLPEALAAVARDESSARQLAALVDGQMQPTFFWGCDDTQVVCRPVCLKKVGVTTTNVPDAACAGVDAPAPCSCNCLYNVAWTPSYETPDGVVCTGTQSRTGETLVVGDLVCLSRDTPKPPPPCLKPVPVARGDVPAAECLEPAAALPNVVFNIEGRHFDFEGNELEVISFAAPAALAAFTLAGLL